MSTPDTEWIAIGQWHSYTYCMSRRNFFGGIQLRVRKWYKRANSLRIHWRCTWRQM